MDLSIYETVVVLTPEVDDDAVQAHAEKMKNFITDLGGTVDTVDLWGRRRLEYEIKRKREGVYYVTLYRLNPAENRVAKVDRQLRYDESVLRFLTVRRDDLKKARARKMKARRDARRAKAEARQAEIAAQREAQAASASAAAAAAAEQETAAAEQSSEG